MKENEVQIPGDSATVGVYKEAICKIFEPKMTTINNPGNDIGEIAAIARAINCQEIQIKNK